MKISLEVGPEAFWRWVALFAYRRWSRFQPPARKPYGLPGYRDFDSPCSAYAPRIRKIGDFGDCEGDGHDLCGRCVHFKGETPDEEGGSEC